MLDAPQLETHTQPKGNAMDSLWDESIITDSQVSDRIDDLAHLDPTDMSEEDKEFWADEIEEQAELNALVAAIGSEFGSMISENYWDKYAAEDADDKFDLKRTGADLYFNYGGYEKYSEDLQTDYSSVVFHGTTYYYAG